MGSHSLSEHSDEGFEENNALEIGVTVGKTISRFIDCVCTEGGVTSEHIRNLHDMVPGVVHMHIESLEPVYLEAKRHPHVQKPKIQTPCLLPGEDLVTDLISNSLTFNNFPFPRNCQQCGRPADVRQDRSALSRERLAGHSVYRGH